MENINVRTMHLFAGHGGGLLADRILGHTPIVAVEWDKYACQVLRERAADGWFPGLQVWEGDVRMFDPSEYTGRVDCIHAGFPCQDISTAGKQAGVGPETRSGLYREVLRIAGVVRPKQLFLENVSAIVSNGLGTVLADLAALGYDSEWLCLRASDCGANHYRDRWWLLANTNNNGKPISAIHDEAQRMQKHGESHVANTNSTQLQRGRLPIRRKEEYSNPWMGAWWSSKPAIYGVDDGVANGLHRLKGIGNGQVPLQAALAYKFLST
jgi:DNA (cytosine-5)-methyltransferase 1